MLKDLAMLRSALTAVQPHFCDDNILQVEITHDDVRVYIKRGLGRERVDTGLGLEANLLEAVELNRLPQQG